MSQNTQILKRQIQQNSFINGLVLSDKDCVEICSAYKEDNPNLNYSVSMMFVAALSQNNDNLQKLCHTKSKNLTLFYNEYIVYIEIWQNVILSIYCDQTANVGQLKFIASELQGLFSQKYNEAIERQQQLNR